MQVSHLLRHPLSGSNKSYVAGQLFPNLRIPIREIQLANNILFPVYDTSGPYTDMAIHIDIALGLPDIRSAWLNLRNDAESYVGRVTQAIDDGYKKINKTEQNWANQLQRTPQRAKSNSCITQLHYAKRGIITPEMEFAAIRENQNHGSHITPEVIRDEIAR